MGDRVVRLDYRQSKQNVSELNVIAKEIEIVSQDLLRTMKSLSGCWEGVSADVYTEKGVRMAKNIECTSTEIKRLAKTMSDIAQAYKRADAINEKRVSRI